MGLRLDHSNLAMETAALMHAATQETGFDDFGDGRFLAPLNALVDSFRHDAWPKMTSLARQGAVGSLVSYLANRLRVVADRNRYPAIQSVDVRNPFIVVGPPRSGSTLLHTLLNQDPENIGVPHWLCLEPSPPPGLGEPTALRLAAADAAVEAYLDRLPEIRVQHSYFVEEGSSAMGECGSEILVMAFTTKTFWYYYPVDSYIDYLLSADHSGAMDFHHSFLQHLLWRREDRRCALKAADHMVWLGDLHKQYPDANFLWTHRDLAEMFGSVASVFSTCRGMSGPVPADARPQMGRAAIELERQIFAHAMAARDAAGEDRFHDVSYHDLMANPVETVRRVYERFGLKLSEQAAANIREWVARNPQTRHGVHKHSPDDFGFSADDINRQFKAYGERFGFGFGIRPALSVPRR